MARKNDPTVRLSIARAVGGLQAGLVNYIERHPDVPDAMFDLEDALQKFEDDIYGTPEGSKERRHACYPGQVLF